MWRRYTMRAPEGEGGEGGGGNPPPEKKPAKEKRPEDLERTVVALTESTAALARKVDKLLAEREAADDFDDIFPSNRRSITD